MSAPGARRVDVAILGAGTIGLELLAQLGRLASGRSAPELRVVAVVDRSGLVLEPGGLTPERIEELRCAKRAGVALASVRGGTSATADEALERIARETLSHPTLVDATAADTAPLLERALTGGFDLVLANKLPLAADQERVDRLLRTARLHRRRVRHEATVGAGLPVIDTVHKLLDGGDRVVRIEGCPSGTLGFLLGELGRGRPFSAALRDAMAAGYTEPDPREDLSGADVARKSLILGRLIGFRGNLPDVAVESLVPEPHRGLPLGQFIACAKDMDDHWAEVVRGALAGGCVPRYRARITSETIAVGVVLVPVGDPLGSLGGTDNQFAFTTDRYRERPLVITGPGAGAEVTAAGIVSDLLAIAAERGGRPSGARSDHAPTRSGRSALASR